MATSPERIQSYQILKKIGKGSYGEVFLVKKRKDKKQFVMKNIRLSTSCIKERSAATQEAELLSQLKHPNIVSYQESFHDEEGILHIVMGYCEGGDLCTRLKQLRGRLMGEDKVVEWFVQIALALQYLHERKIMHRDLKTQNIFLSKHDVVKVGDLGIARVLDGSLDLAHTVVGTPYYMSPELFANKPYDFKSDVWALGCCVYEMATLNHAFTAKNISALMYKILQGKIPPLPGCFSQELNRLVCKMLSLEAKERPSVHQILRTEFVRFHIKQFLDKASAMKRKPKQHSSPTPSSKPLDPSSSQPHTINHKHQQQIQMPPLPASIESSPFLKPLQVNEPRIAKPSPELSTAREKRRRSKQEARGNRVVPKSQSSATDNPNKGGASAVSLIVGEECDGEEEAVLSIMDTTLHLPERVKLPQNDLGACQLSKEAGKNPQMAAIKRYCISALGEDMLSKALMLLENDYDDSTQEQMKQLLGEDRCAEFLVLLQKMKLYTQK